MQEKTFEITNPKITKYAPAVGMVVGVIFIVFGFWAQSRQDSYEATTATVTDVFIMPGTGADNPDRYTPTIEYVVDGETYTATMNEGQDYYEVGQQLEIKYNPANPHQTIDPNPMGPWLLGGFGALFAIAGVAGFFAGRKNQGNKEES